MANSKISALTSASTVVGTEVLPIVQSSATVKVSVANLTPGLDTITAAKGGTGQTSYAVGDILYANTTTTLAKLADVATGNALISGGVGVAPFWGKIGFTTHVSGTLPIANGGTNQTSFTTGYVHFGSFSTDSNFFWDNTNKRLGLGTASPGLPIDLQTTSATTSSNVQIARLWGRSSGNTTSSFGSLVSIGTQNPNGNGWFAYVGALNSPGGGSNYAELGLFSGITGNVPLETARCDYNGYLLVIGRAHV